MEKITNQPNAMAKKMKEKTLLEKAKETIVVNRRIMKISDELIELGIAWMKDEITLGQCARAVFDAGSGGSVGGNLLYKFAVIFRELYREKKLKLTNARRQKYDNKNKFRMG